MTEQPVPAICGPHGHKRSPDEKKNSVSMSEAWDQNDSSFSPQLHIPHSFGFEYNIARQLDQLPKTLLHLTARTAKQTHLSIRGGATYHIH